MRSLSKTNILILGLLTLLSAIGCTRKGDEDKSRIELVMPKSMSSSSKLGSLALVEKLAHVVINVSGEGMPDSIVYNWDGHDGAAAPDAFMLDVPKGNNRLIQILAVYRQEDSASTSSSGGGGSMKFYYGDVVKTLSLSQEGVVIPITSVGTGSIVSGRISGRYLTTASSGPTGSVDIKYYPPNGRPGLIIERSGIYNGWFAFFALSGADFAYELKDGTKLFGGSVNVNSAIFNPSTYVMKVAVPVALRQENYGGGTVTWRAQEPNYYIYGWFGAAATLGSKAMCTGTITAMTKLAQYADPVPGSPTLLTFANTTTTVDVLLNTASPATSYYYQGGTSGGVCSSGTEYLDKLTFTTAMVDGNGNDNSNIAMGALEPKTSGGYRNPFVQTQSAIAGGTRHSFAGTFLPDIYPSVFNQVHVYKRMMNDSWKYEGDSAPCDIISGGGMGFQKISQVNLSSKDFSFDVDVPTGEGNYTSVAVCYANNGMMFKGAGMMLNYYYFNYNMGGGGGGGGPTATKVVISVVDSFIESNACVPILLTPKDASNNYAQMPAGASLNLSATGNYSTGNFYISPDCSGAASSSFSLSYGTSLAYFKATGGSGTGSVVFTGTVSGGAVTVESPATAPGYDNALFSASAWTATFLPSSAATNIFNCVPVLVRRVNSNGDTAAGSASGYSLSVSGGSYSFYSANDPNCESASISMLPFNMNQSSSLAYIRSTVTNPTININGDGLSGTPALVFTNVADQVVAKLSLSSKMMNSTRGYCVPINIGVTNAAGEALINSGSSITGSLSTTSAGSFFSSELSCLTGTGASASFSIAASLYGTKVWYREPTAASLSSVSIGATAAGLTSASINISYAGNMNTSSVVLTKQSNPADFNIASNDCVPMLLTRKDSATNPVSTEAEMLVSLTATSGGMIYTNDSSCTSGGMATMDMRIMYGTSSTNFYFKNPTTYVTLTALPLTAQVYSGLTFNNSMMIGDRANITVAYTGSPSIANFGSMSTGVPSSVVTFTFTNNGTLTATGLNNIGLSGTGYSFSGGGFPGATGTCGATLAAGANCTVEVILTPPGTGTFNGNLMLSTFDDGSTVSAAPINISLTGTGI